MLRPARRWQERRRLVTERRPVARIDRCVVSPGDMDGYVVVIEGSGLQPGIVPPSITVGGEPVHDAVFEPGGRRVSGTVRERPRQPHVAIDLGYARAEGTVEAQ
jgi:hypothetical protein